MKDQYSVSQAKAFELQKEELLKQYQLEKRSHAEYRNQAKRLFMDCKYTVKNPPSDLNKDINKQKEDIKNINGSNEMKDDCNLD